MSVPLRSTESVAVAVISGLGLVVVTHQTLATEHLGAKQAEVHQACMGDSSMLFPLGNSTGRYLASAGDFGCPAKCVDDFIRVHAQYLSRLRIFPQVI